jgi:hypothetical protein
MTYTLIQIDGELKWTDKPKPNNYEYYTEKGLANAASKSNAEYEIWLSTLRPLRDEKGLRELCLHTWKRETTKCYALHEKDKAMKDFEQALSNGIEIPAERCRVEKFDVQIKYTNGEYSRSMQMIDHLILLPLETESKLTFPKIYIEKSESEYIMSMAGTGIVVSSDSKENALKELLTSIEVKIRYDLNLHPSPNESNAEERQEEMGEAIRKAHYYADEQNRKDKRENNVQEDNYLSWFIMYMEQRFKLIRK